MGGLAVCCWENTYERVKIGRRELICPKPGQKPRVKVETHTHRHRYKERKTEQENTHVTNMLWELCTLAPSPSDTLQKMSVLGLADKGNGVQTGQEASMVPMTCI